MVIGRSGADLRPMVPIVVQGADGQARKIPVLLSTGFGEALLLPPAEVAAKVLLAGEARDVDILAGGWEP